MAVERREGQGGSIPREVARCHHRVSNSFQNLISYVNVTFRNTPLGGTKQIHDLLSHITALSSIHELLSDSAREANFSESIDLSRFLERICDRWKGRYPNLEIDLDGPPLQVLANTALCIALISTETLSAVGEKRGKVSVVMGKNELNGVLEFTFTGLEEATLQQLEEHAQEKNGLAYLYAQSALGSTPTIKEKVLGGMIIHFHFPLSTEETTH